MSKATKSAFAWTNQPDQDRGQAALEILGHIHASFTPSADGPGMQCVYAESLYGDGDDVTLAEAIASTLEVPAPMPLVQTVDQGPEPPALGEHRKTQKKDLTGTGQQPYPAPGETSEIPSDPDRQGGPENRQAP